MESRWDGVLTRMMVMGDRREVAQKRVGDQSLMSLPCLLEQRRKIAQKKVGNWSHPVTIHMDSFSSLPTLTPLWLISLALMTHSSHTYSTSFTHLLHYDSYLSRSWLIVHTLTPLRSHTCSTLTHFPYLYLTIYTARYPPVNLAWSYSNIPEF